MVQSLLLAAKKDVYDRLVAELEKVLLPAVLNHTRGHLQEACDVLGLSRNTLKAKMREHSIVISHNVLSAQGEEEVKAAAEIDRR